MQLGTEGRYNPTLVCPYLMPFAGASGISPPDTQFNFGTSGLPLAVTEGVSVFDYQFDSESTSGSSSVEPINVKTVMKGAGGVGGRSLFHMYTNVALGSWANAIKGYTEFGASGRVSGLGSAIVGELALSAGTTQGTYAPLESELVLGTGAKLGTATSFLYCGASGAAVGDFDDAGYFFELAGVTAGGGHVFQTEDDEAKFSHKLRVRIGGTTYYLMLCAS